MKVHTVRLQLNNPQNSCNPCIVININCHHVFSGFNFQPYHGQHGHFALCVAFGRVRMFSLQTTRAVYLMTTPFHLNCKLRAILSKIMLTDLSFLPFFPYGLFIYNVQLYLKSFEIIIIKWLLQLFRIRNISPGRNVMKNFVVLCFTMKEAFYWHLFPSSGWKNHFNRQFTPAQKSVFWTLWDMQSCTCCIISNYW